MCALYAGPGSGADGRYGRDTRRDLYPGLHQAIPFMDEVRSQELVGSWIDMVQAQLSRIEKGRSINDLRKLIY
jgi:hypothetical protein